MLKVAIIGGVAAGMSCAAKLKRLLGDGVDVNVFEKGDVVSYGACGIPYYAAGRVARVEDLIERTPEQFEAAGIRMRLLHKVTRVDTAAKTLEGTNAATGERFDFAYDALVVASGARARRIPPLDAPQDNLLEARTPRDAVAVRRELESTAVRDVVIVGAGFVGVEMAEACVRQGKRVTMVEFAPRLFANFDAEMAEPIARELAANGVELRTAAKATALRRKENRIEAVEVESGGRTDVLPADLVLNCAGIAPNADFIDVDKADNGAIAVNERMETSAPGVYAAGDCSVMRSFITGKPQYAPFGTNANKQGKMIAELLAGLPARPFKLLGSGAVRVFGLDAAKVGLSEEEARRHGMEHRAHTVDANDTASYYGKDKVTIKLVCEPGAGRILGAQIVGRGTAAPRANYFAVAMSAGMTARDFGYADLSYSPPFNGVWDAALIAANTAE